MWLLILFSGEVVLCVECAWIFLVLFVLCGGIQQVMKDSWINISYEDDRLKPYIEPNADLDRRRLGMTTFLSWFLVVSGISTS